ncbi:hypothetical protein [Halobacillus sp. H74]|uniref:hypothetical protein n=1 Tax=Halobacillus sp. H74 TaxID=3457436 RepID=UPI003FCDD35E
MKKRLMFGLGTAMILVWTSVLLLFLWSPSSGDDAVGNHSLALHSPTSGKTLSEQESANFLVEIHEQTSETKTIIGKQVITNRWIDDVNDDGKLSIDTLLETLELDESESDNS